MGAIDNLLRGFLISLRNVHLQFDGQAEAFAFFANADFGVDDRVTGVHIEFLAGQIQCATKASAVTHGEHLLWVGAATGSTLFFRGAQVDINHPVVGGAAAVAATGDLCLWRCMQCFQVSSCMCSFRRS